MLGRHRSTAMRSHLCCQVGRPFFAVQVFSHQLSLPVHAVDALDSDENNSSIGPYAQILSDCGDSRADHRRGLVVEVAPGVVDATAVALPPPDVVESLELDIRVPAFDLVDSDDELDDEFPRDVPGGVPVETAVEPAGLGARHSGRFAVLATDVDDDDPDTAHDSPSLVDALDFDLTRTDHGEGIVEDNQVSADSVAPVPDIDGREAAAHSQPQRRRLVLVNSAPVLDASLDHGSRESDRILIGGEKWLHKMCTLKSLWSPSCRSRISPLWP